MARFHLCLYQVENDPGSEPIAVSLKCEGPCPVDWAKALQLQWLRSGLSVCMTRGGGSYFRVCISTHANCDVQPASGITVSGGQKEFIKTTIGSGRLCQATEVNGKTAFIFHVKVPYDPDSQFIPFQSRDYTALAGHDNVCVITWAIFIHALRKN